jgi:uncharacterized membrane protein YhhN
MYFLVSGLDLIAVGLRIRGMEMVFKPLIIPTLILLYWIRSPRRDRLYLGALFFSLLGDLFLLDKQGMFLFGVAAFLITQLLYIVLVRKGSAGYARGSLLKASIPFLLYLLALMWLLGPGLGEFFYPVLVYGSVISVFGITALQNHLSKRSGTSRILLAGALLFIASDSMIAINKFQAPHMIYPVAIMLTYVLAQYYIYQYVISTEGA